MSAACDVVGNHDIEHLTDYILKCISDPDQVVELMHKLAGVTFVQSVQCNDLSLTISSGPCHGRPAASSWSCVWKGVLCETV
jgi:hypothetical protein